MMITLGTSNRHGSKDAIRQFWHPVQGLNACYMVDSSQFLPGIVQLVCALRGWMDGELCITSCGISVQQDVLRYGD